MKDDQTNINEIVELIKNKEKTSNNNFKIINEEKWDNATHYSVNFYNKNYELYLPPSTIFNQGKKSIIYRMEGLVLLLKKFSKGDYFIKNKKNGVTYSLKNSFNLIQKFEFGLEYEIIENKSEKKSPSFQEFMDNIHSKKNFPQSCQYYEIYCNNYDNFQYIQSKERTELINSIIDFCLNDEKYIFITGQRGIGKTTTILYQFYTNESPFLYINLKYFEKSKDELKKKQILDFEKNNIFRIENRKFIFEQFNDITNYQNEIYHLFNEINHIIYENNKKNGISYISLLIQILFLVYKKLLNIENNKNQNQNEEIKLIGDDLRKIKEKIEALNIPESIMKKESYNTSFFYNTSNLFNIINILLNYQAYLSYLLYYNEPPEYNPNNIWEYINNVLQKCQDLNIEFILILDQYKNQYSEGEKLNHLFTQYKKSKILLCSSIDDYRIRRAVIDKSFSNIIYKNNLISMENIKDKYKNIFDNINKEKEKYINLFKSNTREIFDCLFKDKKDKLQKYVEEKTEKIKNYFKDFCKNDLSRFSFVIFIFKNIYCYWNETDYKKIMEFIPFKYFIFEEIKRNSLNNNFTLGTLEDDELLTDEKKQKKESKNNDNMYYYKINFSMPIVGNALYKFIRDEDNYICFEDYMKTSKKGAGIGITFEEYIKSKISKSKIIFIKNLQIDKTVEIWSLFSKPSSSDIPNLFKGKFEKGKIYFIDIRNQTEKFFDCAFIDLMRNQIIFTQITTYKKTSHQVFNKESVEAKSNEAITFLKNNFIDEDIDLDVGFFFVFLKYDIDKIPDVLDEENKNILKYMKDINHKLDKMKEKCEEQKLKYCIYQLSTNFSEEKKNIIYNTIEPDDKDLFISKKKNLNEIKNTDENIKRKLLNKRNFNEMTLSTINLKEVNLEKEINIKRFYDFYTNKLNLGRPKIYEETNQLYCFDDLGNICKNLYSFAMTKNINGEYLNIFYYDDKLKTLTIQNALTEEREILKENQNQQNYRLYFLGEKDEIESSFIAIKTKDFNSFSKTKKE